MVDEKSHVILASGRMGVGASVMVFNGPCKHQS